MTFSPSLSKRINQVLRVDSSMLGVPKLGAVA